MRRTITAFLLTQMNNGAFRSREPSKAFFVDVSDTLNTPSVIFAGKLIARVGLATNKPAEWTALRSSPSVYSCSPLHSYTSGHRAAHQPGHPGLEAELAAAGA